MNDEQESPFASIHGPNLINLRHQAHRMIEQGMLPTRPGAYLDKAGDSWTLLPGGAWVDAAGVAHSGQQWKEALVLIAAPFTEDPSNG